MDTFTPCPISRIFKAPKSWLSPQPGSNGAKIEWRHLTADFNSDYCPNAKSTSGQWRSLMASSCCSWFIVINLGLLLPEKLQLAQYHVTELIPRAVAASGTGADQAPAADQSQAASGGESSGLRAAEAGDAERSSPRSSEAGRGAQGRRRTSLSRPQIKIAAGGARRNWCTWAISAEARRLRP